MIAGAYLLFVFTRSKIVIYFDWMVLVSSMGHFIGHHFCVLKLSFLAACHFDLWVLAFSI